MLALVCLAACIWQEASKYPDKQIVFRVWEDGNPYSNALSSSSFVAVILLTGGQLGLGADTTSYAHKTQKICNLVYEHEALNQLYLYKKNKYN